MSAFRNGGEGGEREGGRGQRVNQSSIGRETGEACFRFALPAPFFLRSFHFKQVARVAVVFAAEASDGSHFARINLSLFVEDSIG